MNYYTLQKAEKQAEIYIFGDIVPAGFEWDKSEVSGASLADAIKAAGDVEEIKVHINSYGGSVSEGWAIYNALINTKAKITTYGDGFVASAALYPFLAGDRRIASNVSAYFMHEVINGGQGYAEDLRALAAEAETMTQIGVNAFVERAGMQKETVESLMKAETWLTPEQALGYGIATEIANEKENKIMQSVKSSIIAQVFAEQARKAAPKEEPRPEEEPKKELKTEKPAKPKPEIAVTNSIFKKLTEGLKNEK